MAVCPRNVRRQAVAHACQYGRTEFLELFLDIWKKRGLEPNFEITLEYRQIYVRSLQLTLLQTPIDVAASFGHFAVMHVPRRHSKLAPCIA